MAEPALREAAVADAARLAAVYRNAYRQNRDLGFPMRAASATEDEVAAWIRDHQVLVATVDDTVVGGVRLEATGDDAVKLSRLAVHQSHQGEGVGSRLVERAERDARERGFDRVRLTTPPDHPFLPDFYRRHDCEETEPYPLEYRDYDEVVMEKPLR